jgi:transposase
MGLATSHEVRHAVIKAYEEDKNYSSLSRQFKLSYDTVRNLCKRYESSGAKGLLPKYASCGQKVEAQAEKHYRLVRLIKSLHPTWGVPYILHQLDKKYPDLVFQSERHYQRRLEKAGFYDKPVKLPPSKPHDRARTAHETWQIDAKERFSIATGEQYCYLNITDEATGSMLGAKAFPPRPYQSSTHRSYQRFFNNDLYSMGATPSYPNG